MEGKCTIYFEDPFWVGVFERQDEGGYQVAKHVFGAEPGLTETQDFAKTGYSQLKFSQSFSQTELYLVDENYKHRMHRIRKEMHQTGIGTYAQRAIKGEQECLAKEKSVVQNERSELNERESYLKHLAAKKQKHRGR